MPFNGFCNVGRNNIRAACIGEKQSRIDLSFSWRKKKVRPLGLSTEKITHLGRSAAKLLVFSMLSDFPSLFIVERRTPGVSEELSVFVFVLAAACAPEIFVILQFLLTQISGLSSL